MGDFQTNITKEQDRNSYFLAAGKLLGYPECCTMAYIEVDNPKTAPDPQRKIYEESGWFFPCQKHANEIEENEITVYNLIQKRHLKLPIFSMKCTDADLRELDEKVKKILKEQDPIKWKNLK